MTFHNSTWLHLSKSSVPTHTTMSQKGPIVIESTAQNMVLQTSEIRVVISVFIEF